jgi:sigma-B regulation protein RsbU (phosphoserine phosphatase)
MLKVALAGQGAHAHNPALVLAGLNRALCGKFEEHFVTAAYLFVDLDQSLLRYSAAGHPPMMLASRASSDVREIEENGLMLGMCPEATYSSVEIGVGPGDRCLLYTDGIFEAKNAAQEEFGKSRCKEFLETQRDIPAAHFVKTLLDSVAGFSGYNSSRAQEDDITSSSSTFKRRLGELCAERTPLAPPIKLTGIVPRNRASRVLDCRNHHSLNVTKGLPVVIPTF